MYRFFAVALLVVMLPQVALASSVVRSGETVGVAANQAVEGDFYGLGNSIAVSGEITEDLLAVGGALKVNGQVGKDLLVVSGTADIDGVVGEDVRLLSGEVVVSGEIKGDLVVVAGKLTVLSTAVIDGDILFFGSEASIAGKVGKSIYGTSEKVTIDGVIGGDVDVSTLYLSLGDQAAITGSIKYRSENELTRAQNAQVSGKVVKSDPLNIEVETAKDYVVPFLMVLFASLVWYLMFPRLLEKVSMHSLMHPHRAFIIGFALLMLTPLVSGIFIISNLGALLGVSTLFLYVGVVVMSIPITSTVVGIAMSHFAKKGDNVSMLKVILGTISIFVLMFIPLIGPILFIYVFMLTLGSLVTHLYRGIRSL